MIDEALERARLRSNYYRDNFRRCVRLLLLNLFIIFVLLAIVYYQLISRPTPPDYISTADGRIVAVTAHSTAAQAARSTP